MYLDLGCTRQIIERATFHGLLRNQLAYCLASAYHETAHTMLPIKETVFVSHRDKNPSDQTVINRLENAYRRGALSSVKSPYWRDGWFGRGLIQITHLYNYKWASGQLGVDLVGNKDLALDVNVAIEVLLLGMRDGWFAKNQKLSKYITLQKSDFRNARRIVNGMDKASLIAGYAREYDALLLAEGYGVDEPQSVKPRVHKPLYQSKEIGGGLGVLGVLLLDAIEAVPQEQLLFFVALIAVAVIANRLYARWQDER